MAAWAWATRPEQEGNSDGNPGRQADPGHGRAHRLLDRLPRGADRPAGRRPAGADRVRPAQPGGADRQAAARPAARHRAGRGRRGAARARWPSGSPGTSTAWTAWCTASATRRRPRSAATSCRPNGRTWPPRCRYPLLAQVPGHGRAAADGRAGAPSSAWTSTPSQAWPGYDWMGVAKAGLESCSRYLARDLGPQGVRVNLVAAGPLRTMAAKSIPGFERLRRTCGTAGPRSAGTSPTRSPPRGPASRCCPTGSPRPPARSCTPTAASMRSGG